MGGRGTTVASYELPREVDQENLGESLRLYHGMPLDHPDRASLRTRIVQFLGAETEGVLGAEDYDAVVAHFAQMTDLLTPEEIATGRVPRELVAPARWIVEHGGRTGDEARVMSALLILDALEEDGAGDEYELVTTWGRDARADLGNVVESYTQLIRVWDEHARLTPTPDVLQALAELYIERRDAFVAAFREGPGSLLGNMRGQALPAQVLRITPLDVAAVYLRVGDLVEASTHVEAMGAGDGETEARLLRMLEEARRDGDEGADATVQLAEAFREARPEVARGLCRLGRRRFPDDARFPVCLARVSIEELRPADATAWYAEAIDRAPDVRDLYDEALAQLARFIQAGLFEDDPTEARALAGRAQRILEERMRRWPDAPTEVAPAELALLVGQLEMNAGRVDAAEEALRRAAAPGDDPNALRELAFLLERTGRAAEAAPLYRKALDLTPNQDVEDAMQRASLLEHLGDAFRLSGDPAQSERMYQQALALWTELAEALSADRPRGLAELRTGVLHDRLGKHSDAVASFRAAMASNPDLRETYAGILSHLVTVAPDLELAQEVFRRAQRHLTLAPEWKVYFGLWVTAIAGRAGSEPATDVRALLTRLAASETWWGRLARFGVGDLGYEDLLGAADSVGQRAEAHFYGATAALAKGQPGDARTLLEQVLATRMVGFYEYLMAQALLAQMPDSRTSAAR